MKKLFLIVLIVFGSPSLADKYENCDNAALSVAMLAKGGASERLIREHFDEHHAKDTLMATPAFKRLLWSAYIQLGLSTPNTPWEKIWQAASIQACNPRYVEEYWN